MTNHNDLIQHLTDMKADVAALISFEQSLGYPFFGLEINASEALDAWLLATKHLKDSDWRPVLVSNQSELAKMARRKPPSETNRPLNAVPEIEDDSHDVRVWPDAGLKSNRRQKLLRLEGRTSGSLSTKDAISFGLKLDFSDWMEVKTETGQLWEFMQTTTWNSEEEAVETIVSSLEPDAAKALLLYLPVTNSYYMPAVFGFGGGGDCPPPQVHLCVIHHWNKLFGAEILAIGVRLDLWIKTPLTREDEAMNIAKELFVYCPDLVHQGDGTLSRVAAQIYGSKIWSFWWD